MICETVFLLAALAGLPAGACALKCDLSGGVAIKVTGTGCQGLMRATEPKAFMVNGFRAHRVDGKWYSVIEQEPEQCLEGGVTW